MKIKVFIHRVAENKQSCQQAKDALISCRKHTGYDPVIVDGFTPTTLDYAELSYPNVISNPKPDSRAYDYLHQKQRYLETKAACFLNHYRFWHYVADTQRHAIFLEHDSIATRDWDFVTYVNGVICLNFDSANRNNHNIYKYTKGTYEFYDNDRLINLADQSNYGLKYHKFNSWKGGNMIPGTAAYMIDPNTAKDLIEKTKNQGWDQSDFFINTNNTKIFYTTPDFFEFNPNGNLALSKKVA